jgi:hypothetical protein
MDFEKMDLVPAANALPVFNQFNFAKMIQLHTCWGRCSGPLFKRLERNKNE